MKFFKPQILSHNYENKSCNLFLAHIKDLMSYSRIDIQVINYTKDNILISLTIC